MCYIIVRTILLFGICKWAVFSHISIILLYYKNLTLRFIYIVHILYEESNGPRILKIGWEEGGEKQLFGFFFTKVDEPVFYWYSFARLYNISYRYL